MRFGMNHEERWLEVATQLNLSKSRHIYLAPIRAVKVVHDVSATLVALLLAAHFNTCALTVLAANNAMIDLVTLSSNLTRTFQQSPSLSREQTNLL